LAFCLALHETDIGSSFWGMILVLSSTDLVAARIAAACLGLALIVVLFVAKNVRSSISFYFHPPFSERLNAKLMLFSCFVSFITVVSSGTLHWYSEDIIHRGFEHV
jgi:hypothetical protein